MNLKYLRHALQNPMVNNHLIGRRVLELPVCKKCERVALRDAGPDGKVWVRCPQCGYHGPGGPSLKVHAREV